jgi:hypothetical protein
MAIPGPWILSFSLFSVHNEANGLLLHMLLPSWCCSLPWTQKHGAKWPWTEPSKTVSQNTILAALSCLCQVLCHSDATNTTFYTVFYWDTLIGRAGCQETSIQIRTSSLASSKTVGTKLNSILGVFIFNMGERIVPTSKVVGGLNEIMQDMWVHI